MIRRYYILPLRPGVPDAKVRQLTDVLRAADQYIPGLKDSSAGVDFDSKTVLWENTFVDEASYSGPYMVHPYHIDAIDGYVMADSPECITNDIYTARYTTTDATQTQRSGIRRVLFLNVSSDADVAALAALAAQPAGIAASAFGGDDVGWVSAKGRAWSHVWEQAFTDTAQLDRYLRTPDGISCSSLEGFWRLGIHLPSLKIFTFPFELTSPDQQTPPAPPRDDKPVMYTITARTVLADVDRYVELVERLYDNYMAGCGSKLVQRWRTVEQGNLEGEVHSTWRLDSLAAYSDVRLKTYADPIWNEYVRDAMPLVHSGTRRFYHAA